MHTAKASRGESSFRGKGSAPGCIPKLVLPRPDEAPHGGNQGPGAPGLGRQLHSQSVAPFVPRTRLLDWAFSGTLLQRRVRWMFFAGFRCVFGLPSTPAGQGNQPLSRELEAVLCAQARKPSAMHVGEKRPAAGGCLQACIGKDRVSFHTGGAPDLRPGSIVQSPGRKAALACASLAKPFPASSVRAREVAGCDNVRYVTGA